MKTTSANGHGHMPALDGLRGLAILAVLLYHGGYLGSGFVGVDLFFVLSGFLITTVLLTDYGERGRISFGPFYGRRMRRLFPAAFAALLFASITLMVSFAAVSLAFASGRSVDRFAIAAASAASLVMLSVSCMAYSAVRVR